MTRRLALVPDRASDTVALRALALALAPHLLDLLSTTAGVCAERVTTSAGGGIGGNVAAIGREHGQSQVAL
jgi:hypothetical protein